MPDTGAAWRAEAPSAAFLRERSIDLVNRPSYIGFVKKMIISEFKAKCISVMKNAAATGEPVMVTHRGKPLAMISAVPQDNDKGPIVLGAMRGQVKIVGDIINSDLADDWNEK